MLPEDLVLRLTAHHPAIRRQAISELGNIPDPDSLACLVDALDDDDSSVRDEARMALQELTGIDLGPHRASWLDWWKERSEVRCLKCRRHLFADRLYYLARVRLTSEPKDLYVSEEDLRRDHAEDLQKTAEELSRRDPDEARDEVYVFLKYHLCAACKVAFVADLRERGATEDT